MYKEMAIKIMMIENGSAAMMSAFCNACNPPLYKRMMAMADCIVPHVSLTELGGSNVPYVVCIPNMNVAESAEVMNKMTINNNPMMDNIVPIGNWPITAKSSSSVAYFVKSIRPVCWTLS
jgi:hypothetical protein